MSDENAGFYDPLSGGPPPQKPKLMPWDAGYQPPEDNTHQKIVKELKGAADDQGVEVTEELLAVFNTAAKAKLQGKNIPGIKITEDGAIIVDLEAVLDSDLPAPEPEEPDEPLHPAPPSTSGYGVCKKCGCELDGDEVEYDKKLCDDCDDDGWQDTDDDGNAISHEHVIDRDIREAPMYRDGISTTGTYLIMATKVNDKGTYNCVCQGNDKIKFYPNKEYFGITDEDLVGAGIDRGTELRHHGYERYMCSRSKAVKLLTVVNTTRGTITLSANMALNAPRTNKHASPRRGDSADD